MFQQPLAMLCTIATELVPRTIMETRRQHGLYDMMVGCIPHEQPSLGPVMVTRWYGHRENVWQIFEPEHQTPG